MKVAPLAFLLLQVCSAAFFPSVHKREVARQKQLAKRDVDPEKLYPAHNFSLPVDHFFNESKYEPHSHAFFNNRYWFDDTFYKPGGPVFLLIVGESAATLRLPILQKGIIYQFSKAFGGMGVVLEHRYFGRSQPQPDLSVESLRFLTTDQALADAVYFAEHIVFPGHEKENMTAKARPWITYGGSYAGAFTAFLRTLYPGVFWGSISSSGVTEAIYDYWQYYEPVREFGPPECINLTQQLTHMVDNILEAKPQHKETITKLKSFFSLQDITYNDDFANVLAQGVAGWQSLIWDPAINYPSFTEYCSNMTSSKLLYPTTKKMKNTGKMLLQAGGYGKDSASLLTPLLNYAGWINETQVQTCGNKTLDQCWGTHNATEYRVDDWDASEFRSWPWMWCNQWGYLQTGSGVPHNQLPLISRTITLEYETIFCRDGFNITTPPNTTLTNQYGGFDIQYDRLAIVGGEWDPWRPVTPLAESQQPWPQPNTTDQPLLLIPKSVHHWDEYGLFPNETTPDLPPSYIVQVQKQEHDFVAKWLKEAKGKFPCY